MEYKEIFKNYHKVMANVTIRKNNETVSILTGLFSVSEKTTVCTLYNNTTKEHVVFIRRNMELERNHLKIELIDGRELIVQKIEG